MYGRGIRIGMYIQWTATFAAYHPEEAATIIRINIGFGFANFLGSVSAFLSE
jgi:hypothetical protein